MQARWHSREAPVSIMFVCPPVCLSAYIIAAPTGRISVKFDIDVLYQNLSRNYEYKFSSNWAKLSDIFHEDLSTFHCCWRTTFAVKRCCASLSIFMLLTATLTQQYTENALLLATYIRCKVLLCTPQYFYVVDSDINSTIDRERIVAFPLQQWLYERAKMLT